MIRRRVFANCLERLEQRDLLAAGDLLNSFGSQGVVRYSNFQSQDSDDNLVGLIPRPSGGFFASANLSSGRGQIGAVVAYWEDGTLDKSFGNQGESLVPLGSGYEFQSSVAVQPDGKVIVAGYIRDPSIQATSKLALSRLNSNGTIDATFGTKGVVLLSQQYHSGAEKIAVRPNGQIVVLGSTFNTLYLIQLNSDGTVDTSFAKNGQYSITFGESVQGSHLILLDDGSSLFSASVKVDGKHEAQIYRIGPMGNLDQSFGVNGKLSFSVVSNVENYDYSSPLPLVICPDGNVVLGATTRSNTVHNLLISKFSTNGELVSEFGSDGLVAVPIQASFGSAIHDIVSLPDGRIVALGYHSDVKKQFAIWLNNSGAIDHRSDVPLVIDFNEYGEAILEGSRIIFGTSTLGWSNQVPSLSSRDLQFIAFDIASQELDQTFGVSGHVATNVSTSYSRSESWGAIELPNRNTLVLMTDGLLDDQYRRSLVLARYLPNGTLDRSFGTDGVKEITRSSTYVGNLQPRLVSNSYGLFALFANQDILQIVKLTNDGSVDSQWGLDGWLNWDFSNSIERLEDVLFTGDSIFVAGRDTENFSIGKLNFDGELQPFSDELFLHLPSRGNYAGTSIRLTRYDSNDVIAILANHSEDFPFAVSLAKFSDTGELTASFDDDGRIITGLVTGYSLDERRSVEVLSDGKILVFGMVATNGVVKRFLPDGKLDTTFGNSGMIELSSAGVRQQLWQMLVDTQERIITLRMIVKGSESVLKVDRYLKDGSIDTTFGDDGSREYLLGEFSELMPYAAVASHDDLLIAGQEIGLRDSHSIVIRVIGSELPGLVWHNSSKPTDVTADSLVSPTDALMVINYLNRKAPTLLPTSRSRNDWWLDVNNDGRVTPSDALRIINELISRR